MKIKNTLFFGLILTFFLYSSGYAFTLPDIIGHPYEIAIRHLEEKGIIQGYSDGKYRPENEVNRAEFTKIVVGALETLQPTFDLDRNCFPDVKFEDWFSYHVCYAKKWNIISGYPDGNFRPGNPINLSEASKILVEALEIPKPSVPENSPWYQAYIQAMQANHYIPSSFSSLDEKVNRGELAEMVYRAMENVSNQPYKEFVFEQPPVSMASICLADYPPAKVDMNLVRTQWLAWHNQARVERGLTPLGQSLGLNHSSSVWAQENKEEGKITHERLAGQSLSGWFSSVGISSANIGENLGAGTYQCNVADCTQAALNSAKRIFDLFMAEEGTAYTGHYDNIVDPDYVFLGIGLAVDETGKMFYLTSHYAGNLIGDSMSELCE